MAENPKKMKAVSTNLSSLKRDGDVGLTYGRLQPQAVELEEAVVGSLLIDKDALTKVNETLKKECFYKDALGIIYEIAEELSQNNIQVNLLSVHEELKKQNLLEEVGGSAYLAELSNKVTSSANSEYYARIVRQKYILRELIKGSSQTISDSFEDSKDVFEILEDAEKLIYDISQDNMRKGVQKAGYVATQLKKEIALLEQREGDVTGVPTGFSQLDQLTNGWQNSDLIIIAARPAMGKTAFTLALARNAALNEKGVAVFSLEMSKEQLVQRLLSMEAEIPLQDLRTGKIENQWTKLNAGVERMSTLPLFVDDTAAISIIELQSKCRRLKMQHDISMIVIDYLQLMSGSSKGNGTREQEISSISRALKGLAKELEVPVIALSQLSRAVETRGGSKRPMLSDLRESGAIEQDADIVTFLYRPDYYANQGGGNQEEEYVDENHTEIIVSKHRNGPLGTVNLQFIKEYTKFIEPSESLLTGDISNDYNATQGMTTRPSKMNSNDDFMDDTPF